MSITTLALEISSDMSAGSVVSFQTPPRGCAPTLVIAAAALTIPEAKPTSHASHFAGSQFRFDQKRGSEGEVRKNAIIAYCQHAATTAYHP